MKARSVVFTHTQAPFTIFGLPPILMILSVSAAMVAFVMVIVVGGIAFSMIAMLVTMVICLALSVRIARTDRHVVSLFVQCLTFWRGLAERHLVAGDFSGRSVAE